MGWLDIFKGRKSATKPSAPTHVKQKYALGYQLKGDYCQKSIGEIAQRHSELISEVYFPTVGAPSGRAPLGVREGQKLEDVLRQYYRDLDILGELGIPGVVLFNASCYGPDACSTVFCDYVERSLDELRQHLNIIAVTTMSMVVAAHLKARNVGVKLRSSINMQIHSTQQMGWLSEFFDGFYLWRDFNRDPAYIRKVRAWCDEHGKSLHMLVNSGCMYRCPFQMFHANMLSHALDDMNGGWEPLITTKFCRDIWPDPERRHYILRNTWIRPEDISNYYGLFDTMKLATRHISDPEEVLLAYASESYDGDMLSLLEPGTNSLAGVMYVRNKKFPADWFEHTTHCGHHCESCNYCKTVFDKVAIPRIGETGQDAYR